MIKYDKFFLRIEFYITNFSSTLIPTILEYLKNIALLKNVFNIDYIILCSKDEIDNIVPKIEIDNIV